MQKYDRKTEKIRIKNAVRLSGKLKAYWARMVGAVIGGIGNQLSTVGLSVFGAYLVGLALESRLMEQFPEVLVVLIVIVAVKVFFYFMEMWLAHDVAFKVLADFRVMLFSAIERVSPAILLNMRSGQLASTLMSDVEILEWFFAHSFGSILVAVLVPLILLVCLGFIFWALPLILICFLVPVICIPVWMREKADLQGIKVREHLGEANAVTMEGVQGIKEILSLNYKNSDQKKNEFYMSRLYDSQLIYGKRLGTEGAFLQVVLGCSMICVAAVAAGLSASGQIDTAMYPLVVVLAGMVLGPVVEVCNTARNFGLIFAAADRVYRVLEAKPQVEDKGKDIDIKQLVPGIQFESASFRYRNDLDLAVEQISFSVNPGETVALVGPSGAGKSTCIQLILRYWDPESGNVSIGGCNLQDMTLENLRSLTSVVLQDVYLFRDTIRENIRLGKPEATDAEIENVAKMALAHDFILDMKNGYETIAGEGGAKLSGGQRQRIAIARAILQDAPILILDEAVSNLDTENEREIQESIRRFSKNKTTLIVAHRLSTIRSADRIVVLKEGHVVQNGTYEDLMAEEGFFRELISMQMEEE